MLYYTLFETRLGWVGLSATAEKKICRLVWHQPSREAARHSLGGSELIEDSVPFHDLPQRLECYFKGEKVNFSNRVKLSSITPFRYATLKIVRSIPYGETRSYSWIAANLGKPQAYRAVGQALRLNPVPIIIPCHRVVGATGSLIGFSGGLSLKRFLLHMEEKFSSDGLNSLSHDMI